MASDGNHRIYVAGGFASDSVSYGNYTLLNCGGIDFMLASLFNDSALIIDPTVGNTTINDTTSTDTTHSDTTSSLARLPEEDCFSLVFSGDMISALSICRELSIISMEVISLDGRLIKTAKPENGRLSITLTGIQKGIYLVLLKTNQGNREKRLFHSE
jgi:hypothetical protein